MAVFQYQASDSPIHRLHPLAKMVGVTVILLISGYVIDPRYKIPLFLGIVLLARAARLPFRDYRALLILIGTMMLIAEAYISIFLVNPDYFKVYPKEWVGTIIFNVTPEGFPIFGKTAFTYGSLLWLTTLPLTALCVVVALATFVHSTSLNDLIQILSALRVPFPATYITMVALRFIPELVRQIAIIRSAQMLRGWAVETRNPFKVVRLYAPILVPIARHVVKSIDTMTISAQNRGFGPGRVTGLRSLELGRADYLVMGSSLAFFVVAMIAIFGYNIGNM